MTLVSQRQPFCRCCGKPLKKRTELHVFGIPEGSRGWGHFGIPHPENPTTRSEAQRYLNQQVVSVRKGYGGGLRVSVWDGESYLSESEFFCTVSCAATYGRFAIVHAPDLMTQSYCDAVLAAKVKP